MCIRDSAWCPGKETGGGFDGSTVRCVGAEAEGELLSGVGIGRGGREAEQTLLWNGLVGDGSEDWRAVATGKKIRRARCGQIEFHDRPSRAVRVTAHAYVVGLRAI